MLNCVIAISVGAVSVEADVWLVNDTLYVSSSRKLASYQRAIG